MTLTQPDLSKVAEELSASLRPEDALLYRPRYNVAPSDPHWVVLATAAGRQLVPARWGFGERMLINVRSESAPRRGALGRAFAEQRCAVPADGFFEWTGPKSARRPLWFHRPDGGLLYLAGLWEESPAGRRFTVLTTDANQLVSAYHDRMPALLSPKAAGEWLARAAPELLAPAPPDSLIVKRVSQTVNSVKNDDASVLEEPPDERPPKKDQLTLW
jgi:putative SOS response-associated peptidase YedK